MNKQHVAALREGGEKWVRLNSAGEDLDFTNADLRDIDLNSRDFACMANFDGCTFNRVELSASTFQKGAIFKRASFNKPAELRPKMRAGSVLDFAEAEFLDVVRIDAARLSPGTMTFERSIFRKKVKIYSADDEGGALNFTAAKFHGSLETENAHLGRTIFDDAQFHHLAKFRGLVLYRGASFKKAKFLGPANFENVEFKGSSSFIECTFCIAPNFHDAKLHQGTLFSPPSEYPRLFPDIMSEDASNAYRTLKLAMNEQHALSEELGFFLLEMRASAYHQKPWVKPLYWLYDTISLYGMSVKRPLACFFGSIVLFGLLYSCIAGRGWGAWEPELLSLTLFSAMPFAAALRWDQVSGATDRDLFPSDLLFLVQFLIAAQGVISAALLFLVLLGIRNMFKIK
jgi:uncharacterized protein YjbI with pentapeptide repeats